ncbi:MAG: hypothetical protein FIO02_09010 [Nitrosopumilales archaeon]|nr:hypothetical protein [Nitrosopumilales archaeon]
MIKPLIWPMVISLDLQIGDYQIVFQPLPFVPFANEDSTLNFSILDKNNANANKVYAALTILPTVIIVPIGIAIYHRYRKKSTK